jgi:hypothetical protein
VPRIPILFMVLCKLKFFKITESMKVSTLANRVQLKTCTSYEWREWLKMKIYSGNKTFIEVVWSVYVFFL